MTRMLLFFIDVFNKQYLCDYWVFEFNSFSIPIYRQTKEGTEMKWPMDKIFVQKTKRCR